MIREATLSDTAACMVVVRRSLRAVQSKCYDSSVIAALEEKFDEQYFREAITQSHAIVYDALGVLAVAVLDVEEAEIEALFVDPEYLGQGIGSQLLSKCEQAAQEQGIGSLRAQSSLNAVGFYTKHGYRQAEEIEHPDYGRSIRVVKDL